MMRPIAIYIRLSSFRLSSATQTHHLPQSCRLLFSCSTDKLRGVETHIERTTATHDHHTGEATGLELATPSTFFVKWTEKFTDLNAIRDAVVSIDVISTTSSSTSKKSGRASMRRRQRINAMKWMCGFRAGAFGAQQYNSGGGKGGKNRHQSSIGSLRIELLSLLHGTISQSLRLRNPNDNSLTDYTLSFDANVQQPSYVSLALSNICLQLPYPSQQQQNDENNNADDQLDPNNHFYVAFEVPASKVRAKVITTPKPFSPITASSGQQPHDGDVDGDSDSDQDVGVINTQDAARAHITRNDSGQDMIQIFWSKPPHMVLRTSSLYKLAHSKIRIRIFSVRTTPIIADYDENGDPIDEVDEHGAVQMEYSRPQLFKEVEMKMHDVWGCFLHPNTPFQHVIDLDDGRGTTTTPGNVGEAGTMVQQQQGGNGSKGKISIMFMSSGALPGGQLVGGATTDESILDAKAVVFGTPIPGIDLFPPAIGDHHHEPSSAAALNARWREVIDTFGYSYFRHVEDATDVWKQPDGDDDDVATVQQEDDMCAMRHGLMVVKRSLYYNERTNLHSWIHPEALHPYMSMSERDGPVSLLTSLSVSSTVDARSATDVYVRAPVNNGGTGGGHEHQQAGGMMLNQHHQQQQSLQYQRMPPPSTAAVDFMEDKL